MISIGSVISLTDPLIPPTLVQLTQIESAAKLQRLAGEQVQFECQLSPLRQDVGVVGDRSKRIAIGGQRESERGRDKGFNADDERDNNDDDDLRPKRSLAPLSASAHEPKVIDETPTRADISTNWLVFGENAARYHAYRGSSSDFEPRFEGSPKRVDDDQSIAGEPLARDKRHSQDSGPEFDDQFEPDDSIELILWYHNESTQPIYSVDARQQILNQHHRQQPITTHDSPDALIPVPAPASTPTARQTSADVADSQTSKDRRIKSNYAHNENSNNNNNIHEYKPAKLVVNLLSGKHFASARLSSRVKMKIDSRELKAHLIVDKLEPADAGQYKCRVDFKYARTKYQAASLDVIG